MPYQDDDQDTAERLNGKQIAFFNSHQHPDVAQDVHKCRVSTQSVPRGCAAKQVKDKQIIDWFDRMHNDKARECSRYEHLLVGRFTAFTVCVSTGAQLALVLVRGLRAHMTTICQNSHELLV